MAEGSELFPLQLQDSWEKEKALWLEILLSPFFL